MERRECSRSGRSFFLAASGNFVASASSQSEPPVSWHHNDATLVLCHAMASLFVLSLAAGYASGSLDRFFDSDVRRRPLPPPPYPPPC